MSSLFRRASSRREFLKTGGMMGGMLAIPSVITPFTIPLSGPGRAEREAWHRATMTPPPDRVRLRAIAERGIESARAAGADYADVRITESHTIDIQTKVSQPQFGGSSHNVYSVSTVGMGIRALVNGYWGYASHTTWSADDVVRLAHEAVGGAKSSATGPERIVKLASVTPVPDGDWKTPFNINTFTIPFDEILDEFTALGIEAFQHHRDISVIGMSNELTRDFRVFASTDGTFITQTFYRTGGDYNVSMGPHWRTRRPGGRRADALSIRGGGWESVLNSPLRQELPKLIDEADRTRFGTDVDIGRFDVVFDARAMSCILSESIGSATDLYRAMGYDANEDGTSFLDDPQTMIGSLNVAAPAVTITGDRTMQGGTATVAWDDEGVASEAFPIVKDGRLVDFQTSRESASWLEDYYTRTGTPIRSHACTGSNSAVEMVSPHQPNLSLTPNSSDLTLTDLCKDVERGYLVLGGETQMDHQCVTGYHKGGAIFEIRNGKLGQMAYGAGFLFNTMEFWKNIEALGGASSVQTFSAVRGKSYEQRAMRSMRVPPARVRNVATVDMRRKGTQGDV